MSIITPLSQQVEAVRDSKPLPKQRISPKVRKAITIMVWDGLNRPQAAQQAGITDSALYQALKLPKVKALLAQEYTALREGAPFRAYRNIVGLGEDAKSEDVKLRANQWVAGVDGLAPVSKVQTTHRVSHSFEGFTYERPVVIEGDATSTPDEGS